MYNAITLIHFWKFVSGFYQNNQLDNLIQQTNFSMSPPNQSKKKVTLKPSE